MSIANQRTLVLTAVLLLTFSVNPDVETEVAKMLQVTPLPMLELLDSMTIGVPKKGRSTPPFVKSIATELF